MKFICYSRCSTCRKAEKWLLDKGVEFSSRDIKEDNPNYEELEKWHKISGLDIKRFFNTSGMKYRELKLKDKLADMTLEEKYKILASDGMLVKRPLLIADDFVLVGFKEEQYLEKLG